MNLSIFRGISNSVDELQSLQTSHKFLRWVPKSLNKSLDLSLKINLKFFREVPKFKWVLKSSNSSQITLRPVSESSDESQSFQVCLRVFRWISKSSDKSQSLQMNLRVVRWISKIVRWISESSDESQIHL